MLTEAKWDRLIKDLEQVEERMSTLACDKIRVACGEEIKFIDRHMMILQTKCLENANS